MSRTKKYWFTTGSGRIELRMTMAQAQSASHPGPCDSDVMELSKVPAIAEQLNAIDPKLLASELREHGAWDEDELANHAENIQRLLWIAASDIVEESRQ